MNGTTQGLDTRRNQQPPLYPEHVIAMQQVNFQRGDADILSS